MKNVIKPLAQNILIPLGLTAVASAADVRIHKKILGSGNNNNNNNDDDDDDDDDDDNNNNNNNNNNNTNNIK